MYASFWRILPGPWPVRTLLALTTFAAIVVALFGFGFPAVEPHLPWSHDTVSSTVDNNGDYPNTTWTGASPSTATAPGATTPSKATAKAPAGTGPSVIPGD